MRLIEIFLCFAWAVWSALITYKVTRPTPTKREKPDGWISVKERLPKGPEYDWVLVQERFVPEGWYGIPRVAELRNGVWYGREIEEPFEKPYGVEVTHWMPLPEKSTDKE